MAETRLELALHSFRASCASRVDRLDPRRRLPKLVLEWTLIADPELDEEAGTPQSKKERLSQYRSVSWGWQRKVKFGSTGLNLSRDASAVATELIRGELVWNNHACMPLRPHDTSFLPQLRSVREAGVDVLSLNIGFGPTGPDEHLAMLGSFTNWLAERPDDYLIVRSTTDILAAKATGRLGVFFDVEGMAPLNGGRIDLLETFRKGGVGWMLIAYNRANDAGYGCYDEVDGGLTAYGREVIAEMKRVGMLLCCSHTGWRTAMDAIEHGAMPIIFSHSNVHALDPHARNIPDELIDACAASGGVVGINGLGVFLGGKATPERVADHVEYIASRVGDDHVGLALDYVFDRKELAEYLAKMKHTFPDDDSNDPLAMLDDRHIAPVARELVSRGFSSESVSKIVGGNWLRVAERVWG